MRLYNIHLKAHPERSLEIEISSDFLFQKAMNYSEYYAFDFSNYYLRHLLGCFQENNLLD